MFSRPAAALEPRPTVARKAPPTLPEPTNTTQKNSSDVHADVTAVVEGATAGSATESKPANTPEAAAPSTELEDSAANTEPEGDVTEAIDS